MEITLEQARALCAVVDRQGYQAAAAALHKSHSSIVYAIKGLEEQCGFPVLDRTQYRSTLTPRGRRIYEKCGELLSVASELKGLCSDLQQGWEPSIRIVYDGVLPTEPLLEILRIFTAQKIPTRVQIYSEYLQGVESTFHGLDAHFMVSVVPPKGSGYVTRALKPMRSLLVAHKDHPLSTRAGTWTLDELKRFTFLTVRGADDSLLLGTKELEQVSTFHLSDFGFKKTAILKKVGFGWLPEYMIRSELKSKTLVRVKWERASERDLRPQILYKKEAASGRAAKIVLESLMQIDR